MQPRQESQEETGAVVMRTFCNTGCRRDGDMPPSPPSSLFPSFFPPPPPPRPPTRRGALIASNIRRDSTEEGGRGRRNERERERQTDRETGRQGETERDTPKRQRGGKAEKKREAVGKRRISGSASCLHVYVREAVAQGGEVAAAREERIAVPSPTPSLPPFLSFPPPSFPLLPQET